MKLPAMCGMTVLSLALCACAAQQQQASSGPRSPAQLKQDELKQMEQQGQRNDFDKVRIN